MEFIDSQPIYLQIANYVCEQILLRRWKEEERLPSVRELSALLEVNPNTIMRAYDFLQGNEIIYNKRGIGYFVTKNAIEKIIDYKRKQFVGKELPVFFKNLQLLDISLEEIKKLYEEYNQQQSIQ
ncbi:MAG TPA: GntR family transcriptional regulator [Paludibacteraceae bacterium]|nr:GntR family transcriptional regulator [Paludibacteraceae bacterium]HOK35764.1 GntR family transcriptional regulator [Paludibacteraceae bacterium]HOL00025.1 GntR family transcriptional regulator [Paludibacteraceae bacterium]HPC26107.1 GntR family transcriptional regulator [Paludibacteraceae bacterium]HPO67099.1 GntR family transcriptional regulator [Paludibacteraceae bacterium]